MDRQYGMADFFTMEATEYLERLDALVSASDPPAGEELQRLARALRGAALMANQQPIAATAGAFEHLARAIREGRHEWDAGTRQLAIRTVDDLKVFVRRAREWSEADTARARELAATLERAGGRAPAPPRISAAVSADAGTRAFVAREGAALASSLARVAEAVQHNPAVTEPVQALLRQMQPLRGLATLGEFPPLPDLLDGIDRAAALVARAGGTVAEPGALLEGAARALTNATRAITTTGKADPDAPEVRRFAAGLRAALGLDRSDVDIETLYAGEAPIAEMGGRPHSVRLGQVELTSLGEHLKQIGVSLASARTVSQRALRVLALVDPLRTLELGVADPLQEAVRTFARACRDAITHDVVIAHPEPLGHAIQEAGIAVAASAPDALARLTGQIAKLVDRGRRPTVPAAMPVEQPTREPAVTPAAAAAPAVAAAPAAPVRAPAPPPSAPPISAAALSQETPNLGGSLLRYERLVAALGLGGASLDELIAGPPADPALVAAGRRAGGPAGGLAAATAAPVPAAPAVAPAAPVHRQAVGEAEHDALVPIESLCYSGKSAVARALNLRKQLSELVAAGAPVAVIEEVLDEVFDLVRLATESQT